MTRKQKTADEISWEMKDYVETACSEAGHAEFGYNTKGDCRADELFEDATMIVELVADRIWDETHGNKELRVEVAKLMPQTFNHLPDGTFDIMINRLEKLS